jgi:hypothetical protein
MTSIASKLSAVAASVFMSGAMMAGVICLFALQAHPHLSGLF